MSDQDVINAALRAQSAAMAGVQGIDLHASTISQIKVIDNAPVVVSVKAKSFTWVDRLKKYYKATIAFIGALLITLNELSPITDMFSLETRHVVTVVITCLTAIGVALKENEHWIQDIPS